jgi:hypothetical protein
MWLVAFVGQFSRIFEGENSTFMKTVIDLGQSTESGMLKLRDIRIVVPSLGMNLSMELEYHPQSVQQCLLYGVRLLVQEAPVAQDHPAIRSDMLETDYVKTAVLQGLSFCQGVVEDLDLLGSWAASMDSLLILDSISGLFVTYVSG